VDERITISADPNDHELGFPPFSLEPHRFIDLFTVPVYHPVTWIDKGVLTHLAYDRTYAISIGRSTGLPNSGAFRIDVTGPTTPVEEMIATTKRGVLVTRFDESLQPLDFASQLFRGYTRDGLWLIENGKISKPIKNLVFTESPLFVLNNIEQLGVPQRVYHGGSKHPFSVPQPRFVPPLKVRDFSFTALTDAV
jgi:predicted Zn-dependent protease